MTAEVTVCGGGIVGMTLASAFAEDGFRVTLIEGNRPKSFNDSYDPRVSAISCASKRIFESLGVWDKIKRSRVQLFDRIQVWDQSGLGEIAFEAAEVAEPALGYIIENQNIEHALQKNLDSLERVVWIRPANIVSVVVGSDQCAKVTTDIGSIESDLVVAADGTLSKARESVGIEVHRGSYNQAAIVVIVKCQDGHKKTAWQRFLPSGPIALLPLPDDHACIVWSHSQSGADNLLRLEKRYFDAEIQRMLSDHVGRLVTVSERFSFPLGWMSADEYVRERFALVGDAAHTIHPLAGQGVNLGIVDAAALAQVMADASAMGRDPISLPILRRYERWRRGHTEMMQTTMDIFFRLFGSHYPLVRTMRNVGLAVTNRLPAVKRTIIKRASGFGGDLPRRALNND